ncbi:MAG: hypothetical protein R3D84_18465 [Paracoccaceae bacterium]
MQSRTTNTAVVLLFRKRPRFSFADYVAELETALKRTSPQSFAKTWEYDDFASIDIDGSRVVAAASDMPENPGVQGFAAMLVLSVGYGPDETASTLVADNRDELCRTVVRRMERRHPADHILWKQFETPFTPDDLDRIAVELNGEARARTARSETGLAASERFSDNRVQGLVAKWLHDLAENPPADPAPPRAPNAPSWDSGMSCDRQVEFLLSAAARSAEDSLRNDEARLDLALARELAAVEAELRLTPPPACSAAEHKGSVDLAERPAETRGEPMAPAAPVHPPRTAPASAETPADVTPRRRSPRPAPLAETSPAPQEPAPIANDMPDLPHPMVQEMQRIRGALYAETPQKATVMAAQGPLPQRLTIYTMNTALIIAAMPVGAALLTYNCLGREDIGVSARAMALTGAVIALAQSTGLGSLAMSLI